MTWARKRAVDVHDETASYFSDEYSSDNVHDSPFRYGRSLVDALWSETVAKQPPGALCLDIGCGIGTYMTRLIEAGSSRVASSRAWRCESWPRSGCRLSSFPTAR